MSGALDGIRIVELAGLGALPFASLKLADMGADVIRVDRVADVEIWVDARHAVTVVGYGRFRDRC